MNAAVKVWSLLKKYLIPTAFAAVFYIFTFLLGNRTLCVFKTTYGIPCPGCGMTRAFIYFFRGNISKAFYYHPLFFLLIITLLIVIFRNKDYVSKIYNSKIFWIVILVVFIIVWAVRMVIMFPNLEPLDFNHHSLLSVFYKLCCQIMKKMVI